MRYRFQRAFRFLGKAEEPFQPALLHPGRRHFLHTGVEIERRPDAQFHGLNIFSMQVCKNFLLRRADAEKKEFAAAAVDAGDGCGIFLTVDSFRKRRRLSSGDLSPASGTNPISLSVELREHLFGSAVHDRSASRAQQPRRTGGASTQGRKRDRSDSHREGCSAPSERAGRLAR